MSWILALALLIVPFVEVGFLVQTRWPLWFVLLECGATAGAGYYFARGEDWSLWTEIEADLRNGHVPTAEAVDALLMLAGAWALMIPGLFTDALGAALLVPQARRALTEPIRRALRERMG
jgi:UPF0716 protein FxsA